MKKNLRLLCLGLAAAAMTTGFAQENVTLKYLKNSSFESGVLFWDVEFESQVWGKNVNKSKQAGFYGFSGTSLEVWNGSVLQPNSVSQTISNLPNGTYVFGAYVGASYNLSTPQQPTKVEGMTDEEYKATDEYKEWKAEYDAIRAKFVADSVFGVKMFANLDSIPVATEHPDRAEEKRHTVKFNIATQVTDGKLTVGLDVDSTNCVYVTWDEAELYSFGNMTPEEALNAMAKIDAQKPVLVADTVKGKYMNADTLAYLNEGYAAIAAVATPADFTAADEMLRWGVVLANRSANDYKKLANKIAAVTEGKDAMFEKVGGEWLYEWYAAATENMLAQAQAAYDGKAANRAEINELVDSLTLSYAELQFEELDYLVYELGEFINNNVNNFGDGVGMYPTTWKDSLNRLNNRATEIRDNFSRETALEDVKLIADIENSIAACKGSVIVEHQGVLTAVPLVTLTEADGTIATKTGSMYSFRSGKYSIGEPISGLRLTVTEDHWGGGSKHVQDEAGYTTFAMSEVYLYDGNGNQIKLSADNVTSNATQVTLNPSTTWDADAVPGNLVDGEASTYFHSSYGVSPNEAHYIEITLPGGVELVEFMFGWDSRSNQEQGVPKTVEVSVLSYVSEFKGALMESITDAKNLLASTPVGNAIGFYNVDLTELNAALAAAEALVAAGGTDEEYQAALNTLNDAMDAVSDVPMNLPVAGKEYRVISAGPFFATQKIHKALTVYTDTVITEPQIWWETAGKDSLEQVFTFTPMENEDDKNYFVMKNVKTGKYVGEGYNEEGEMANFVALTEVEDTIEIRALGAGQVGLYDGNGMFHTGSHNGGAASTSTGAYGGVAGVYSQIVHWTAEAGSGSAWYICEMSELPLTALTNTTYYLYEEVAVVAFVADKATEFEDFAVYGVDGQLIEAELEQMGNTMLVTLPEAVWAFSYSFNNKEGVNVTVNKSKIGELRAAYDEAAALAPEEGTGVGQYSDLSAYNKAMTAAEELLSKGATDAEVDAAVKAIEEAVAALVPNMPAEGKQYYIISALEAYEQNHEVPMAIYARKTVADGVVTNTANWFYISSKPAYHWEFEVAETRTANPEDEAAEDTVLYNIKNVESGLYIAPIAQSAGVQLTAKVSEAGLYSIDINSGTSASISLDGKNGANDYVSIHCGGHSNGAGKAGNIVGWNASPGASQWKICEVESVLTDLDFTVVEDSDEQVAPAVKGIYDLYGRRVIAPTAPGIYIIDGKKRVIK